MYPTETLPTLPDTAAARAALVRVGEHVEHLARYSREEIARFATLTCDTNPMHHDHAAAVRAGLADVIASGQHTSALMSGLAASFFSRGDDGVARSMLCLHFNFAYRAPIFAGSDVAMRWVVSATEWNTVLGGVIAQLEGKASVGDVVAVVARGTVLVRHAA